MSRSRQFSPTKLILIFTSSLAAFGFAAALIFASLYSSLARPANPANTQTQNFTIDSGESINSIASRLHSNNLIRHPLVFKLTIRQLDLAQNIQAGTFQLNQSMTTSQIATALTRGQGEEVSVTLLEGWRRQEIAQELATQINSAGGSFDPDTFFSLTADLEGRLFPDTYRFAITATEPQVVTKLTDTFASRTQQIQSDMTAAQFEQTLIMASIVEREAREDRPLVAGILWKRFENDWPLQADATLQYAKGYDSATNTWWPTPLAIDKDIDSPFNTYQNVGLPPAPIANPSLDSIQAAANPESSDFWYYITDLDGNMHYAIDYDQHLNNVNRYLR